MRAFSAVKAYGNMTNSRQVCTVQLVRHLSEGSALRGPLGQMCVCVGLTSELSRSTMFEKQLISRSSPAHSRIMAWSSVTLLLCAVSETN